MVLSKPVALVLGPLVATPQPGHDVGYELETISLTYAKVLPLGQLWSSHWLYPLISPMFCNTHTLDSEKLLNIWSDWNSVYQFDHGLHACYSVRVPAPLGDLTAEKLNHHPLCMGPGGSPITVLPAARAAMLDLVPGGQATAAGAWIVSKMLLIPEGTNLLIGFGVLVDNKFLHETFLATLAAQHSNSIACHVTMWLQGNWCDSWFQGVHQDPASFSITIMSWSQICKAIEPFFDDIIDPAISDPWVFPMLMWQGMAHLHHDQVIYHIYPQLSAQLGTCMQQYFKKHHLVLSNTLALPPLALTDQFLGYSLCTPSVKEWPKCLKCSAFLTGLPPFPGLM